MAGSVPNRLVVSTQCPTCGAPLDFDEGSNCVACSHCRSNLLVTGRGQLLSYLIAPRLDARAAFGIARFAEPQEEGPCRFEDPRLFFLPYYRFRALEFRWQRPDPEPRPREIPDWSNPQSDYAPSMSIEKVLERLDDRSDEVEFRDRHLEKNFLAVDFPGVELYSLGLRPTVLKLSLFSRAALDPQGTLVAAEITPEAALDRGRRLIDAHKVAYHQALAPLLSLVYFPFWFVGVERQRKRSVTIVDGVSQSVVKRGESVERLERFHAAPAEARTLGFRPLVCPNCDWDLPLRPDDVIFYCASCSRAWKIAGDQLAATPHRIAEAPGDRPWSAPKHLPFWRLRGTVTGSARGRFLVPAFRCRRLKTLADLAMNLSREEPALVEATERKPNDVHGAYFDEADAAALALFADAGEGTNSFIEVEKRAERSIAVEETELVWLPFAEDPYSFREPFTGTSIPKNLVI